uniref:Nucleotide-binding alpha-beta plait domain-containing protein n=1 Tax=Tanacetum cinerariifolium TaxID=118510 RepID=A0A699GUH2_TANCI|nr:nucleotide-binding alpha-beta plait domain-containing protein [Tanacetum cinerariifolium]
MGTYRSEEDDVAKISTTVYVTNFPESIYAKELFHSCKVYGYVVDSFIPNKRAKNGNRFGFVRFINVFSDERLVNNLCTVWIDRYKLHANISRFHRNSGKGAKDENKGAADLSNALLGRVNEFTSLANLKMALCNEGFVDIKIQYMGEFWVMMEFTNKEMIKKFRDNEDSCFQSKRLCIHTKLERSISEEFKIIHRGKIYWIRAKETPGWVSDFAEESDDEDLDEVNSNDDGRCDNKLEGSLKYPPGFSPKECNEDNSVHVGADIHLNEDGNASNKSKRAEGIATSRNNKDHMKSKDDSTDSVSSGHFKKSEAPRTGGSILGLLDEVVKVGQIMGYKMEGCMSNMTEIIEVQREDERCWGNLTFDYVHSAAVGNSGGILCVWDPNCFCKENVTMSDSFVMVRGVWRSTGQKHMLIAVYAPHDTKDKHMLWDYLQREIRRWK